MPDNYFARYLPVSDPYLVAGVDGERDCDSFLAVGKRKPTRAKMSPYECGMTPIGDARSASR